MFDVDILLKKTFLAQVEHHAVIHSTNDRGRECPIGPSETPRLIVADTQTAGRGRDQNRWWTGPRSLAFSLVLDGQSFRNDPQRRLLFALVAGIAVTEAIESRGFKDNPMKIGLKWPNDVLVNDKKLCGILVEIPRDGRIIIGIGINTNDSAKDAPPELTDRLTTLRDLTDREHDHTTLLMDILCRFEKWHAVLLDDPARIGRRADELCLQHNQQLSIDSGDGKIITGRCLGIASDGAICLETPNGSRTIYSGRLV